VTGADVVSQNGNSVLLNLAGTGQHDVSLKPTTPGLAIMDTTTGQRVGAIAQTYTGPVSGLQNQYIYNGSHNVNISVTTDDWFLHGGSGDDGILVYSGTNVIDGGTGSNFLTGGSGTDTFYVDDRSPSADIWSTIVNFQAGDDATVWGVTPQDFHLSWQDNEGAAGYTGLTLHATAAEKPTASLTLAGYTSADLDNSRLSVSFGSVEGNVYMHIFANG
jgi:serralysin